MVKDQSKWTPEKREQARQNALSGWKNREARIAVLNRRGNRKANGSKSGRQMRNLRLHLGMNQTDFAVALGLSENNRRYIGAIEAGVRPVPENMAHRMNALAQKHNLECHYTP